MYIPPSTSDGSLGSAYRVLQVDDRGLSGFKPKILTAFGYSNNQREATLLQNVK
jgi:hypothetical protein